MTEADFALRLEWLMRTGGAEALAFDVACLSGPEAALPHGAPGDRPVLDGAVLLFDFGAQVGGYRSDMTRTLFVGEPSARDLDVYELVARAQGRRSPLRRPPSRRGRAAVGAAIDAIARAVIAEAGHGERFGHGTGHGIGLATHEGPSLGAKAPETPLPSPTVFSSSRASTWMARWASASRISSCSMPAPRRVERLTRFPREVLVVGH